MRTFTDALTTEPRKALCGTEFTSEHHTSLQLLSTRLLVRIQTITTYPGTEFFMLKIITPKGQKFHQSTIESFLDLLRVYQNFELSHARRKSSTFLIAEDSRHGIYGGALLYPQITYDLDEDFPLDDYDDTFRGTFVTFQPQIQEFWTSRICYCREANLSPFSQAEAELCKRFYHDLYEALLDFGDPRGIEFLAFSLCSFDTIEPPYYKEWPELVTIRHSDDMSGLFHGILPLKGLRFFPKVPRKSKLMRALEDKDNSRRAS